MKPDTLYARYVYPENGLPSDTENCNKNLSLNSLYKIDTLDIGLYYTSLTLTVCPEVSFNSVNFDFYEIDKNGETKVNIYSMPKYIPYLQNHKLKGERK